MFSPKDNFIGFARRGLGAIFENPIIAFGAIALLAMLDATILLGVSRSLTSMILKAYKIYWCIC